MCHATTSMSPNQARKFRRVTIRGAQPSARALRGNLPRRGLCGGLSAGSAGALSEGSAGLCGALRGSAQVRGIFRGFLGGSDPMLVTLGHCCIRSAQAGRGLGRERVCPSPLAFHVHIPT